MLWTSVLTVLILWAKLCHLWPLHHDTIIHRAQAILNITVHLIKWNYLVETIDMSGKVEIFGNDFNPLTAQGWTYDIFLSKNTHRSSRCICHKWASCFWAWTKGIFSTRYHTIARYLRAWCENLPDLHSAFDLDHFNGLHVVLSLVLQVSRFWWIYIDLAILRLELDLIRLFTFCAL